DGALSLYRPLGYQMLEALDPVALAPGYTELIAGPRTFLAETRAHPSLPYIATNWKAEEARYQLPRYRIVPAKTEAGIIHIGFVAMLDPVLATIIPQLSQEGVDITEPIEAIQNAVDEMYDSETPPDMVLMLTTAGSAVLETARRELRGVDLMVGDQTLATLRVLQQELTLRPLPYTRRGAPATLSMDGIATAELWFEITEAPKGEEPTNKPNKAPLSASAAEGGPREAPPPDVETHLRAVRSVPRLVRGEVPLDMGVQGQITAIRARQYPRLDKQLIPAFSPTAPLKESAWAQLVCESVRTATGADSVFLHELPPVVDIPGPMTELQVVNQLAMLDTLQTHWIPGGAFNGILDKAFGMDGLIACGATPTNRIAQGRGIDGARTYRVVSTDRTVASHPIGPLLTAAKPGMALDGPGIATVRGPGGQPATLRETVLDTLREIRDEGGHPDAIKNWILTAPTKMPPQWLVRVRQLNLRISQFQGTDNASFAEVPETLATSPSSFTFGSDLDVAFEYSSPRVLADIRARSMFTTLRTEEDVEPVETADDLRGSSSFSVPHWKFPVFPSLQLMPYTEALFDTEYTAIENDDGTVNSRQSDLSQTIGVSAVPTGWLGALRIGSFVNRDIAQFSDKPPEFGGKVEWATAQAVGTSLRWTTSGDIQIFANTPDDDASDLRLRAFVETRFSLPLARFLNIDFYAQGFGIQGRVPENDDFGFSYTIGSSLSVTGAFQL
ncbi:MAG: hypothetical protein AAFV53_36780, partial [Myxococcota bacterium]